MSIINECTKSYLGLSMKQTYAFNFKDVWIAGITLLATQTRLTDIPNMGLSYMAI